MEPRFYHIDMTITAENLTVRDQITADLVSFRRRLEQYRVAVCSADMVVVTLVCSDSRVVLPEHPVLVTMKNGQQKNVIFVGVPTIGGGAPSRSRLRGVIETLESWGVNKSKISVLATQHGDCDEIAEHSQTRLQNAECSHKVTCGLRKFFEDHEAELLAIRELLVLWTHTYKRKTGNRKAAPDRLALSVLKEECPDVMHLIDTMHKATGLPRRLLIRAAYRNTSFDIHHNELDVAEKINGYLADDEYASMFATCLVGTAQYNHQRKQLVFDMPYANLGVAEHELQLPGLRERHDSIQSPENVIISFGENAICVHNGVTFPSLAGVEAPADNVFRACASIPTVPTLMCALAEAFYAVVHKVAPHHGNQNFKDLKRVIINCDTAAHVKIVETALRSFEFQTDFLPVFKQLNNGRIGVVNLNMDKPDQAATYQELDLTFVS